MKKILKAVHGINPSSLRKIVDILLENELIHMTVNGDLAVGRDFYVLTLYDLYRVIPSGFWNDENDSLISGCNSVHLETISRGVTECLKSRMERPLAPLLEDINQPKL